MYYRRANKMQINENTINLSKDGIPTDDLGRAWDTAQEWIENAVDQDHIDGEYSPAEWKSRCKLFAAETRYMIREMRRLGEI